MDNASRTSPPVTPQLVMENTWAFARTRVLVSAVELDLFTHIGEGHQTAAELARAAQASERGVRMLLNALTALGLLQKEQERYSLNAVSRTFLTRGGSAYLGTVVRHAGQIEADWMRLTDIVRTGQPALGADTEQDQGEYFVQFVDGLYALNAPAAEAAARRVLAELPDDRELHVLDVGAGSGVWGYAFARLNPRVRVTVADWPAVLDKITRPFAERHQLDGRVDYLPGDFRHVEFPEGHFDVAVLGHICHSQGAEETRRLFARLHRALRPQGQLVIADWLPDAQRAQAVFPLLFAVNMLVHTEHGDTFTVDEYREWLQQAGFEGVEVVQVPSESPVIVARRGAAVKAA